MILIYKDCVNEKLFSEDCIPHRLVCTLIQLTKSDDENVSDVSTIRYVPMLSVLLIHSIDIIGQIRSGMLFERNRLGRFEHISVASELRYAR